jgi:hypothetical protein
VPTPTPGGPVNGPVASPSAQPTPAPVVIKPIQMTNDLGLDATSPIVWIA